YWSNYPENRWVVYEHCEWEGEPDDDNLWSCYVDDGVTIEYETWWQYCEHDLNESLWYCTDEFGEEMSSPDNQNGTLYQPQKIQTTVNYDPDDPTRIAFVEWFEWHEPGEASIELIVFISIIDLVLIGYIVTNIIRYNQGLKSSD
ncbi:MAG: hypothetical protein VYA86_03785, partial [Candidatus Thermoplasmatota archaeon]|nr:hypothetical protein [Candidatus Thermoplasmatota archaeon]